MAIPVVIFDDDAKLKCMEYLLQVYDEMDDRSRELEDTLTSTVEIVKRFMDSTYLHHIATSYSSQKLMNILQKHKNLIEPVLNQKDQVGTTPLHVAVKWHNVDIAKCLIQCEADVLSRNNRGETPVYLAALNGQVEILEEILQKCKFSFDSRGSYIRIYMWKIALEQIFSHDFPYFLLFEDLSANLRNNQTSIPKTK